MQILASPVPKPIYGTKAAHALCQLLGSVNAQPLLELDRLSAELTKLYVAVPRSPVQDNTLHDELNKLLQRHQGKLQAGLSTLEALVSLMSLPIQSSLPALMQLDTCACSLCEPLFRQSLGPARFAFDLGRLVERYQAMPQVGMMTLTTLYGVLTMPQTGGMQAQALQELEMFSNALVQRLLGEVQSQ